MNRKITRFAFAGKCGGRAASGLTSSGAGRGLLGGKARQCEIAEAAARAFQQVSTSDRQGHGRSPPHQNLSIPEIDRSEQRLNQHRPRFLTQAPADSAPDATNASPIVRSRSVGGRPSARR